MLSMSSSNVALPLSGLAAALALALAACTATPLGATEPHLANAQQKAGPGGELFQKECASCHGKRGEGLGNAPSVIGSGALPVYPPDQTLTTSPGMSNNVNQAMQDASRPPGVPKREAFKNAQNLYDYVSTKMPLPRSKAGTLKPEEYWAITNFMLLAHGSAVPDEGVSDKNASSVTIAPK
jgi:mono/diheme cytochrome c family protein